jgi:dTMP kinase
MRPYWVTLEGIEGVGKTYFARLLAARLGDRGLALSEVTDHGAQTLQGQIIAALSRAGDLWLRTGHPATETLALLALKVSEHERAQRRAGMLAEVVVEDRGVDSVALYQAAILAGLDAPVEQAHALAQRIYATACHWRPPPDRTLLLIDDTDRCLARFEHRTGRAIAAADRALVNRAAQLYAAQAAREPARFCTVNRAGRSSHETLEELCRACARPPAAREQPCAT